MICIVITIAPMYHFDEKHAGLDAGIAVSGNGCGSFLMPLIMESLITEYGWRGSLLIFSGFVLNIAVCGALLFKRPIKSQKNRENSKNLSLANLKVFKNISLALFLISQLVFSCGLSTGYVHIAALVEKLTGVERVQSAIVISTVGILNFLGRITHGAVAGLQSVNVFHQYGVSCLINAVTLVLLPNIPFYPVSVLLAAIYGFFIAPYGVLIQLLIPKMVGLDNLKIVYSMFTLFSGIGWIIGAPIAGRLYNITGNYATSMYFGAATMIGCVILYSKAWAEGSLACQKQVYETAHHYVVEQENCLRDEKLEV